ncbi:retrovirus-related pol polyprotein from transposon TNT 1-94 [Tanacetum coccineum]
MEHGSSGSHNYGKSKTGKKKNFKCFKCGKQGHFKKDCRGSYTSNPQGNVTSTSDDGNALCCEAAVANEGRKRFADVLLFDTGASFHMTARREWFHLYKPISGGGSVYSCNDNELKIIGIGSIMVKMHNGIVRTIRDVRHVEGLKKNLLSLGQLDDLGCKVEIQNKIMKVIKGALVLMRGEKVAANLYQLKGEIIEEAEASIATHSPSHKVAVTWHQKLGHMSEQGMKILVERKLIPGLTKVSLPFCEYCVISKQHRLKFKASNSRSVSVLELVHSDVWQAPVLSLGGAKYFVSFIDDYSRRCWVYPIKKKSDVFEVFKVYKARVELDSGKKIKCLRTDNGGEYTGDEFDTFCRQEGIKRQFTTAYTPQQNGVAERMNRTLLERARAMLATTSLGKSFWAEAVNTACYVINRSPSTAVELKTPMEMWTGNPVNYSDLHIFGSPVYVMYNSQETTKLDPKFRKCLFLGYADGVKGYRLWDPTAHKVIVSKDVVFTEDKIQENEEGDSITRETTTIQMEKEFQLNDSSEIVPQHEVNETTESQAPTTRTSDRERRHPDASFWKEAMQEEIQALHKNKTWELVPLPGGKKPIGNKWVNKFKRNSDDQMERYRARLVVKGYAQKEGIDFNEIFSPCGSNDNCSGPNKDRISKLKAQLAREFDMKDLGPANKILWMFNMQDCKPISTPFPTNIKLSSKMSPSSEKERMEISRVPYASAVGSLMFAMICTRPNIAHAVGVASRYMAEPDGSKSTTGYVFTLSGETVSWVSKLQSVVAMSTTEAEYVAVAQASKEVVWLKMLLEELGHEQEKITLFCDNQSALYLARNPAFHSKTKHIRVQYHFVREKVEEGTVDMQKIHTDDNVADYMTKAISCDKFIWCRSSCSLAET